MSIKQSIAKKGAAAIYVVIFTATLLSVISLSFIRLMLSEMSRTTNYSLSQSAYNSALAGIEDAKIALLRYQNCVNTKKADGQYGYKIPGESTDGIKPATCETLVEAFTSKAYETAQDCDAVGSLLGYDTSSHETILQTNSNNNVFQGVSESAKTFDQAYTCVRVSAKSSNYITKLTKALPTKIIPLRTASDTETNSVNRIVISWFSRNDLTDATKEENVSKYNWFNDPSANMSGSLKNNNSFPQSGANSATYYANSFTDSPVAPPVIQATLIQTAKTFKINDFYSAKGEKTNRGTIMLRPTTNNIYGLTNDGAAEITNYSNHLFTEEGGPFVASARKSQNSPLDVYCYAANGIGTPNGYSCTADILVPRPIANTNGQASENRNYSTFFLVINLPYGDPSTEVEVRLKNCANGSSSIYDETQCKSVDFANVQPIVDSTGRANDLFRRIEARIELIDNHFPIANYALAVDDEGDNDNVDKNFYVTENCKYQQFVWDGVTSKLEDKTCNNSGRL